jgi:hypothetical protein
VVERPPLVRDQVVEAGLDQVVEARGRDQVVLARGLDQVVETLAMPKQCVSMILPLCTPAGGSGARSGDG